MKKIKSIALFIIAILICSSAYSQKFLALDKGGKVKRIKFYAGDFIYFKTKAKEHVFGTISLLKDSSLIINNKEVFLKDIQTIHLKNRFFGLSLVSNLSWVAGVGYFALDSGNRLFNKENPIVQESTIKTGAIFLGISLLTKSLTNRTYKINKRHPIKIMDISI